MNKQKVKVSTLQKKILLLLLGGLALGLSYSPRQYFRILKEIGKGWQEINRSALNRAIRSLYKSKLVKTKSSRDGTLTLILSENGKTKALSYNLEKIKIRRPEKWDGYWRIVMFDVPEKLKKVREALRYHLKRFGFHEFQKSVFISPFPCQKEIEYLTEFYNARRFVRFMEVRKIDNELDLEKRFDLL